MASVTVRRDAEARKRIGAIVRDRWRLEGLLGTGGMGAVYEARHRNGSRAAIKVLHEDLALCADQRERFRREAYAANRVEHPAVVRVLDDDEVGDAVFLVMELVEGQPLDTIPARSLTQPDLLDLAEQVLDVLVVAHARGVIHRDIKPQNLLLDRARRLRILDFGIASVVGEPVAGEPTEEGILGTVEYMAPEQLRGEPCSARSDIFALGATMFTLGAGEHLHDAPCTLEHIRRTLCETPRSLSSVVPHFHPDLVALVDRATRPSPTDRWPSAEQMRTEVRRIRGSMPRATWDLGRTDRSEEPTKRLRTPPPAPLDPAVLRTLATAAAAGGDRAASTDARSDTRTRRIPSHYGALGLAACAALLTLLALLFLRVRPH